MTKENIARKIYFVHRKLSFEIKSGTNTQYGMGALSDINLMFEKPYSG